MSQGFCIQKAYSRRNEYAQGMYLRPTPVQWFKDEALILNLPGCFVMSAMCHPFHNIILSGNFIILL